MAPYLYRVFESIGVGRIKRQQGGPTVFEDQLLGRFEA